MVIGYELSADISLVALAGTKQREGSELGAVLAANTPEVFNRLTS
jgi:hypothetical protein